MPAFRSRIHGMYVSRVHFAEHILIVQVPLATLVSATEPPRTESPSDILSQRVKRYFVVHGGLFSKDEVTLEDIRKIDRVGRQPGTEGLMCKFVNIYCHVNADATTIRRGMVLGQRCLAVAITCLQLLWTDPQVIPGRGPSKRVSGRIFGPVNDLRSVFRALEFPLALT